MIRHVLTLWVRDQGEAPNQYTHVHWCLWNHPAQTRIQGHMSFHPACASLRLQGDQPNQERSQGVCGIAQQDRSGAHALLNPALRVTHVRGALRIMEIALTHVITVRAGNCGVNEIRDRYFKAFPICTVHAHRTLVLKQKEKLHIYVASALCRRVRIRSGRAR
jgi:hypothetical protein